MCLYSISNNFLNLTLCVTKPIFQFSSIQKLQFKYFPTKNNLKIKLTKCLNPIQLIKCFHPTLLNFYHSSSNKKKQMLGINKKYHNFQCSNFKLYGKGDFSSIDSQVSKVSLNVSLAWMVLLWKWNFNKKLGMYHIIKDSNLFIEEFLIGCT